MRRFCNDASALPAPIYTARFGAAPQEIRLAVDATRDAELLKRWLALFSTAVAETIAATVGSAQQPPTS